MLSSSSLTVLLHVRPPALTSSVALTVRDDVDNEEGVTESENDDSEVLESTEHKSDRPAVEVYVPGRLLCSVLL